MKAISISIPKPCHEDWNKMTPDAKGAFCASCQKSVYDFSNKTDAEIIDVFEKKGKEKVCGRFAPSQLSRPVVSFGNPTATRKLAMFAYALLLVFGATLFNGNAFGQERVKGETKYKMMGKPSVERLVTKTTIEDVDVKKEKEEKEVKEVQQPITRNPIKCGLALRNDRSVDLMSLGQTMIVEEPIRITGDTVTLVEQINVAEVEMMKGEIEYVVPMGLVAFEEPVDTVESIQVIEPVEETEPIELIEPINSEPMLMVAGGVSYVEIFETTEEIIPEDHVIENSILVVVKEEEIPEEEEFLPEGEEEVIPEGEETDDRAGLAVESIIVPPADLQVKVSPNPSRGQITLTYTLSSQMPVRIDLYDNTGKMIRNLTNIGSQYAGKYNSMFNIEDLQNGTYTAVMTTADRKVSAKVMLTK